VANDCNSLLYLTTKHVFEIFRGAIAPVSPLVAGLVFTVFVSCASETFSSILLLRAIGKMPKAVYERHQTRVKLVKNSLKLDSYLWSLFSNSIRRLRSLVFDLLKVESGTAAASFSLD